MQYCEIKMKLNNYKRICIITAGRINKYDTTNNGLLFRSLFKNWPKENLSQIYNSGSNNDEGFFSNYYQLNEKDRRYGKIYKIVKNNNNNNNTLASIFSKRKRKENFTDILFSILKKTFIETGLYELIFRPCLSTELKEWINTIKPDIILAQGYSLTFSELPLLIKNYTNAKLAFFTTDDWPQYLYSGSQGESKLLSFFARIKLKETLNKLIEKADIPIAFGSPMQEEYTKRYRKPFQSLFHADDPLRFEKSTPTRLVKEDTISIVTVGTFDRYRWPLVGDISQSCKILKQRGIDVQISVISSAIDVKAYAELMKMEHVKLYKDPGSDSLPKLLKGADILLLIEAFDNKRANAIKLSISTKAHLFMFSKVPILVYANPLTGIANYAQKYGWACILGERNIEKLAKCIEKLYYDQELRSQLIDTAYNVGLENHDLNRIEKKLFEILQ